MSYKLLRSALASRLEAIPGVGRVYPYFRWTAQAPGLSEFQEQFAANGIMNVWMIRRTDRGDEKTASDDARYRVQHQVEISAFYALNNRPGTNEEEFQDLVDLVVDDLRDGDRTLGGLSLTHTDPECRITHASFCGVNCHAATLQITLEETVSPMTDEILLLPSAARTASATSEEQTNRSGKGLALLVTITAVGGSPGQISSLKVQVQDGAGIWRDLYTFGSLTLNAPGFHAFVVYPAELDAEGWAASIVGAIPYRYRVAVGHENGNSITYSLAANHLS